MEKTEQQKTARRIIRAVAANLSAYGYKLTKPSFLTKSTEHTILFFHFHKFTFGPYFRLHGSVRVLNDDLPHIAIGGWWVEHAGRFGSDPTLTDSCIQNLTNHLLGEGIPYHERWCDPHCLLNAPKDVLPFSSHEWLRRALAGEVISEHYDCSRKLLGIKSTPQTLTST